MVQWPVPTINNNGHQWKNSKLILTIVKINSYFGSNGNIFAGQDYGTLTCTAYNAVGPHTSSCSFSIIKPGTVGVKIPLWTFF